MTARLEGPRAALIGLALLVAGAGPVAALGLPVAQAAPSPRLQRAIATRAATRAALRVLGDATTCAEARFVSYRRSDAEPEVVNQWYVASQLWADATLLLETPARGTPAVAQLPPAPERSEPAAEVQMREDRCHIEKGFIFLDRLWDYERGGYYPHADPSGLRVGRDARYGDDNALAGLALLATAETARDDFARRRYLHAARREAEFLIQSGLWDETFGGGFWWNTSRGDTPEGKPAQTNALAALFFASLHRATGADEHRAWAVRTLLWLDTLLYDPERRLYRWSVSYGAPAERSGPPVISPRYFNYDQGLAIQAQLLAFELDGDPTRPARARAIGRALHETFWESEHGGYSLQSGIADVHTSYAAWTSLGHLALYEADGDPGWLDLARANADALAAVLAKPDGGYGRAHRRCPAPAVPACEHGEARWGVDETRDGAAQAWMQHLQTALARRPVARERARGESAQLEKSMTSSRHGPDVGCAAAIGLPSVC